MTYLDKPKAPRGSCPHPEQLLEQHSDLCQECQNDPSQRSYTYEEMAQLTHETQVALFGWCACEDNGDNGNPHEDCPNPK